MTLSRLTALTLLAAAGFALLPRAMHAQDKEPPLPRKADTAFSRVKSYQENPRTVATDPQAREHMKAFAQYYADFIAHPLVYRVIQDPSKLPAGFLPSSVSIDERTAELGRYLMEPHPTNRSSFDSTALRVTGDHVDYNRELGAALDAALIKVVNENPDKLVKINAMRMYVTVCKTGAPAHWPTVTNLLKDPKTRTEIKVYALQAAANLLWAYDPDDYPSRRHSIGSKRPRDAADQEIGALVKAVEDCVTTPTLLLADYPDGKDAKAQPSANQVEVVRYVRREAIRALAQVRFVTLPGPGGKGQPLYPAYTLARVCMSDPTLGPTPTPSESAEAVIGLANMAPVWNNAPVKNFNADALALAAARGIVNFASRKANTPTDQSIKWMGYAIRMSDAFRTWPPIFNFLHNPVKPNPADAASAPAVITDLIGRAQNTVLTPMSAKAGQVNVADVTNLMKTLEEKPGSAVLFPDVPATTLPGFQKK